MISGFLKKSCQLNIRNFVCVCVCVCGHVGMHTRTRGLIIEKALDDLLLIQRVFHGIKLHFSALENSY